MIEDAQNEYKPISRQQIKELTDMYKDYLYFVRKYELTLQKFSKLNIANFHSGKPLNNNQFDFPWNIWELKPAEQQHFDDFINEKIHYNTGKAYITLQRTNSVENKKELLNYVPHFYNVNMMDMPLPSAFERYVIVSPEDAKIGNTMFLIDGKYRALYNRPEKAEMPVSECLNDAQTLTEFRILIKILEMIQTNDPSRKAKGLVLEILATENTAVFENSILEILGSFAEKLQKICRKRYKVTDGNQAFELAQKEGLIGSAENFHDYVNIRNLVRHQWDSMDELGYFDAKEARQNSETRGRYIQSYLKLCDKTMMQRKKSYIDVLHQMQQVIGRLNPDWMIREVSESNSHFAKRVKERYRQNPKRRLVVELNHPLNGEEYQKLSTNLHKIVPQIEILDDFSQQIAELEQAETEYCMRAGFLQKYHSLECQMMTYCIMSGRDLKNRAAWEYLEEKGIIDKKEVDTWQTYSDLRNDLSHNYFNKKLRQRLREVEHSYISDINDLAGKLFDLTPVICWIQKGVYEYLHRDGSVVRLDFNKHEITLKNDVADSKLQVKIKGKLEKMCHKFTEKMHSWCSQTETPPEVYPNGVEIAAENGKIMGIKLPNGVTINLDKLRIIWDAATCLHTNADNFNALQTTNHKLITDKDFRVTEFTEKNRRQPVRPGDTLFLDYRHRALLDADGCLREFKYKNADGNVLSANFKLNPYEAPLILLTDGTRIALPNGRMEIMHGGMVLNYENRQEFAASYAAPQKLPPQLSKGGNGR